MSAPFSLVYIVHDGMSRFARIQSHTRKQSLNCVFCVYSETKGIVLRPSDSMHEWRIEMFVAKGCTEFGWTERCKSVACTARHFMRDDDAMVWVCLYVYYVRFTWLHG